MDIDRSVDGDYNSNDGNGNGNYYDIRYPITTFITKCNPYLWYMIDQAALVHLIKPIIAEIKRM